MSRTYNGFGLQLDNTQYFECQVQLGKHFERTEIPCAEKIAKDEFQKEKKPKTRKRK